MFEEQEIVAIKGDELVDMVRGLADEGYRLVQICCTKLDVFHIDYSFDKDYRFLNLRLPVPLDGARVSSVTGIYWGAFTYENEIHDLFGVEFEGINIDYGGNFYRIASKAPFSATEGKDQQE